MVILVTGGMGFIGSHTAQALAELGHDVVVTTHRTSRPVLSTVSIEQVDVTDRDAMLSLGERYAVAERAIDGIVHLADPALAHLADPAATATTLVADLRAGSCALYNVLECALACGARRVTVASTIGAYGGLPDMRGLREDLPLPMAAGGNVVAASKKSAELICELVGARGSLSVASVRLPAVFGPGGRTSSRFFAAPGMVNAAVRGEPAPVAYADDAIDTLYVKDCARAIALLQTADELRHATYNVGAGHAVSNGDVAAAIKRVVPEAELPLEAGHSPHGAAAYLDTTRLREDTGFAPLYDLERAVADYVEWLRATEPLPGTGGGHPRAQRSL